MNATPQRSVGVTLTAVVSILGSALLILFAALMLVAALVQKMTQPGMPAYTKTVVLLEALLFAALAAWGISTAVGLFRLRGWARWSTIVFSALLVVVGTPAALMIAFIQFPAAPGAPAGLMTVVKVVIICFYGVLALLGAWWLYFFHTAGARAQFGAGSEGPGGRPLSLWIIAWLMIVGGLICLAAAFFPFPTMVFAILLRGWTARLVFLAFAVIECWLGVGLLRLRPLSRVLAIAFFAFGVANVLVSVFVPGFPERIGAMMDSMPGGFGGLPGAGQSAALASAQPSMLMAAVMCAIPIWFLVARRGAFAKPPGSEQIGGQQPL
jgi:hypothetical protein